MQKYLNTNITNMTKHILDKIQSNKRRMCRNANAPKYKYNKIQNGKK